MVELEQVLDKYGLNGEKTGWPFVKINAEVAQ
jgi:hypothetical protein